MSLDKTLDKYEDEFEKMTQRVDKGEKPLRVLGDYEHLADEIGVNRIGLSYYFLQYIRKNGQ